MSSSFGSNPNHMRRLRTLRIFLEARIHNHLNEENIPDDKDLITKFGNDLADKIVRFEAVNAFIEREEKKFVDSLRGELM